MGSPENPKAPGGGDDLEFELELPEGGAPHESRAPAGTVTPPPPGAVPTPPPGGPGSGVFPAGYRGAATQAYPTPAPGYPSPVPGYPSPAPGVRGRAPGHPLPPPGGAAPGPYPPPAYPSPAPGYPSPPPGAYGTPPPPGQYPAGYPYPSSGSAPAYLHPSAAYGSGGLPSSGYAPVLPDELAPGTIIDEKYEILAKLGQGGMGAVYRARHRLLEKEVAIKLIAPHLAQDRNFRARFAREARVAMEFVHRHAVAVREFGVTREGFCYMTMDFSTGRSLRALVEESALPRSGAAGPDPTANASRRATGGGPLPVPRAARIVRMILEAVGEAHRKKIIHRDLKPDNVLVEQDEDGNDFVKVLDFGLAKLVSGEDAGKGPSLQSGEAIIGTPAYMSPEQACGEEVDHRADLYSCGIILYQLVTGRLPFEAPSARQIILKQVSASPPPFAEVAPGVPFPEGFEAIVRKALAKEKHERFQTAEQFRYALERYAGDAPLPLAPPSMAAAAAPTGGASSATQEIGGSLTGLTIDRYKIIAPIAEGGMGAVYRAEHLLMKRECAFKVMKADLAKHPELLVRFQREAQVSARFKHPSAVEVYDFGPMGDNMFFMAMELVRGKPLTERIAGPGSGGRVGEGKPLPLRDAVEIACQVLEVLDAAHKVGIVHRDLKPDNIMLQEQDGWPNQVKVLDFGIAKMTEPEAANGDGGFKTQQGVFFGTPQYASPEQCKGESVDARSDLYTMGVILFEMLTGRLPFVSDTPVGYLGLHMVAPPRTLAEANPEVAAALPSAIEQVLARALAKEPEKRFASAHEFAEALCEAADIYPAFEVGERGVRLSAERTKVRRSRLVPVLVALVAVAIGLSIWLALRRPPVDATHGRIVIRTTPPGVTVTIRGPAGGGGAAAAPETRVSGHDGGLDLPSLDPGSYTLAFARDDFEPLEQTAEVVAGTTLELPVVLRPSRAKLRRAVEDVRASAERARGEAQAAGAAAAAGEAFGRAAQFFADAEAALAEENFDLAKERFALAQARFDEARGAAARHATEETKVRGVAAAAAEARQAAEDALAGEFPNARLAFERAEQDERQGMQALEQRDLGTARARLEAARDGYAQAREIAGAEVERQWSGTATDFAQARGRAEEARAAELAKAAWDEALGAAAVADASWRAGRRTAAIGEMRKAAEGMRRAEAQAQERRVAQGFVGRVNALRIEVEAERERAALNRASAEAAGAPRFARARWEEALEREKLADRLFGEARARIGAEPETVAPDERAAIERALAAVIAQWRGAADAYVEAERATGPERERQGALEALRAAREAAGTARAECERALGEAREKAAELGAAEGKAAEARAVLGEADAGAALAEMPGSAVAEIRRVTEAAQRAARLYREAALVAATATQAAEAARAAGDDSMRLAAVRKLLEKFQKAMETKNLAELKRTFVDLPKRTEDGYKRLFEDRTKSLALRFEAPVFESEEAASAVFTLTITESGRPMKPSRGKLTLGRFGGGWLVERIGPAD